MIGFSRLYLAIHFLCAALGLRYWGAFITGEPGPGDSPLPAGKRRIHRQQIGTAWLISQNGYAANRSARQRI
jgi:hypothetical protein